MHLFYIYGILQRRNETKCNALATFVSRKINIQSLSKNVLSHNNDRHEKNYTKAKIRSMKPLYYNIFSKGVFLNSLRLTRINIPMK